MLPLPPWVILESPAVGDFEVIWLPAAACLLVGGLVYRNTVRHPC
jgi:hypothetical protein